MRRIAPRCAWGQIEIKQIIIIAAYCGTPIAPHCASLRMGPSRRGRRSQTTDRCRFERRAYCVLLRLIAPYCALWGGFTERCRHHVLLRHIASYCDGARPRTAAALSGSPVSRPIASYCVILRLIAPCGANIRDLLSGGRPGRAGPGRAEQARRRRTARTVGLSSPGRHSRVQALFSCQTPRRRRRGLG